MAESASDRNSRAKVRASDFKDFEDVRDEQSYGERQSIDKGPRRVTHPGTK